MTKFHTDEYIDLLEAVTPETADAMTGGGVRCLTGEDCPAFEGVYEFCTISAGGSLGEYNPLGPANIQERQKSSTRATRTLRSTGLAVFTTRKSRKRVVSVT